MEGALSCEDRVTGFQGFGFLYGYYQGFKGFLLWILYLKDHGT